MTIANRTQYLQNMAKGLGFFSPLIASGSTITAGAAASGFFTLQIRANGIGSSYPSTLIKYPTPPTPPSDLMIGHQAVAMNSTTANQHSLVLLYKLGTLNLAATGDQFTHDTATFPVTRTVMGASTTPISLIPLIQITTATTTTAAVFRLRTAGGSAGYVNQDGTSVIGTKTMTLPSAATSANSCFIFRLEEGDTAITDISNIEVTTAAATGAATIWGMETLSASPNHASPGPFAQDHLFGGLSPVKILPAAATSGTASTVLGHVTYVSNNSSVTGYMFGALNT